MTVTVAVAVAGGSGPGSPGFGTDGGPARQPLGSPVAPSLLPGAPGRLSLEGPRLVGGVVPGVGALAPPASAPTRPTPRTLSLDPCPPCSPALGGSLWCMCPQRLVAQEHLVPEFCLHQEA